MRNILKVVLIGLFVLTINKPLFVFALGEIDGVWIGEETISFLDEQVTEITGTVFFQESDSTLYIYDDLFGAVLLVKSGDQWVLPSPLETTYHGYRFVINEVSFIFHGNSYLTGTFTATLYAYGEEYLGYANLSFDKQFCQALSNGATVSDLSGEEDSLQSFEVDLPPGAINLNVQTWGGSGDCDLYLTYSRPDFYSDGSDDDFNDEEITVASPSTGKWYIVLEGCNSYSGVNLRITYDSYEPYGELVSSDLWIGAIINSEEKGPIEAVWQKGGEDTTSRGDTVIWGHFYASPTDVAWGSQDNPDLFVKIWFDVSGRVDVNFFHVSVPDIVVYSDYPYDGTPDEQDTTTMSRRYIRQYYENGQSHSEENYEDGLPAPGYSPANNPFGCSTINNLRFGAMINTVEKGSIEAVWRLGGQDTTARGDQVVWGHFYADPSDVTWGSRDNPDLFVKIWFDVSGRIDVNFFHVSVPDIEVYSDYPDDGTYDQKGTTIIPDRYIRHEYGSGDTTPEKCANIAGTWHGCEEGTITCTAAGETITEEIYGCTTINIEQNGCEVRWGVQGYDERAGTIDGNHIHVSGIFMVPLVSGFSFTQNIYTGEGTISGDEINLNGSGIASGTFCYEDDYYNFSCTGSSTVTLTRGTGTYQSGKTIKETDITNGGSLFVFGITN